MENFRILKISNSSEILFFLEEYQGQQYAIIRKFIFSNKYSGPTKNGINLTESELKQVYKAIKMNLLKIKKYSEGELLSITKNETSSIKVTLVFFKGHNYIDIRRYFKTDTYEGPTKKGIMLSVDYINDVIDNLSFLLKNYNKRITAINRKESQQEQISGIPKKYEYYFK